MSVELLERVDPLAQFRNRLRAAAGAVGEWAGVPLPIEGESLSIAPGYPFAQALSGSTEQTDDCADDEKVHVRNTFWSTRHRRQICVFTDTDGLVRKCPMPGVGNLDIQLRTLGVSAVWGIEQEQMALQTLGTLIRHSAFKQYLLTGAFIETSPRSGVIYMFRRLRPTIAIRPMAKHLRVLCALCMHPVGYYNDSWGGAMCPTDDVIAHLVMMRGDEHMFWKRCNQHAPNKPEAGL